MRDIHMIPSKIRVKLISEAAGYISVAHVVQRDFSMVELLEMMLPVLGGDALRIRQILRAGTIARGDYRYRWEPLEIDEEELDSIMKTLPGPEPSRTFQPESCFAVRFRRNQEIFDLSREAATRKPLFARQSFWQALLELLGNRARYFDYSHADQADIFRVALGPEMVTEMKPILFLLRPKSMAEHLERFKPEVTEWLSRR